MTLWGGWVTGARICKRLRRTGIDSEDSNLPGWESIPGLLKWSTNTGSAGGPFLFIEIHYCVLDLLVFPFNACVTCWEWNRSGMDCPDQC
jgi:hypothetical protein